MKNLKYKSGLPANAKLVFTGKIFEIWQWEQEMFDGTKQIFEKVWREPGVEIIATVGDKIIIEDQDQPDRKNTISLPSGRADQSENLLAEAKRELLEETGYSSEDWVELFKFCRDSKVLHEVQVFVARNCQKIQDLQLDAGEKIETRLITFEELINLTEEPRFWVAPEFISFLLRLQISKQKREEFRKLLFSDKA
ncbi:MAG: NUDIX hydrolase [Patescibacteria group bacterium]